MWENLPLWPAQASTMAGRVDALYVFLILVTGSVSLLVWLIIFILAVKYRHGKHPKAEPIEGSTPLEITWSVLPIFVFMAFYAWGAAIYFAESRPPKGALDVYVTGKQWMWKTQHVTGQREINSLHVPAGRDVRLTMISQDVIHDFYIPAFRIKMDVLPGRYTTQWFHATKPGTYHLFCAEYCGTQHSGMIGQVVVMEPHDFQEWLLTGSGEGSMASTGQKLFQELGCATCHRFDVQGRAPNIQGLYGKTQLLADGRTVIADENYIRESILNPNAKIVAGFQPIMPTFNGIVSEDQLLSLVAYVKSLQSPQGPAAQVTPAREPVPGSAVAPPAGTTTQQPQQQQK
jgi:cytochrome c oxidase subunit 2